MRSSTSRKPDVHCNTLLKGNDVVGYCTFGEDGQVPGGNYDGAGLDIGLGIKPTRTGSGRGHHYAAAVIDHASTAFEFRQLRVTIATGNKRAVRVWSSAGFAEISRFATPRNVMGSDEFVILASIQLRRGTRCRGPRLLGRVGVRYDLAETS